MGFRDFRVFKILGLGLGFGVHREDLGIGAEAFGSDLNFHGLGLLGGSGDLVTMVIVP